MYESENENYIEKKTNNQSGFADNSMENEGIDQDNAVSSKYPNSIFQSQNLSIELDYVCFFQIFFHKSNFFLIFRMIDGKNHQHIHHWHFQKPSNNTMKKIMCYKPQ